MDEKLKAVLHKVVQLTRENPEFNTELRKALEIAPSAMGISIDEGKLDHIYEYCIEEILEQQSNNFYKKFERFHFYSQLKYDYKRMERFARRNEFGDYSLALFQQIECLLNVIFSNTDFINAINKMWDFVVYFNKKKQTNVTIANVVFGYDKYLDNGLERARENKFTIKDKLKIVTFFFKHIETKNFETQKYSSFCDILWHIYQCRNSNHRGNNSPEEEYENFLSKSSYTYFLFGWSLTQFMEMVEQYDITIKKIIELSPAECDAVITSMPGSVCFVKYWGKKERIPENLFSKVRNHKVGDTIVLVLEKGEIKNIKT